MQAKSKRAQVKKILRILREEHPDARCLLNYSQPHELLVATILSAQCTDEKVNQVTTTLFPRYPTVEDFARARLSQLERLIRPTGFFRQKAKSVKGACQGIISDFGGKVPGKMEDLITLPGTGRKTANVVLNEIFDVPGIVVDTHVKRLAARIGLTDETVPEKVELALNKIVPQAEWRDFSHLLGFHGRRVCLARKPRCEACKISRYCRWGKAEKRSR